MAEDRDKLKADYQYITLGSLDIESFSTRCLRYLEKNKASCCFRVLPLHDVQENFLQKAKLEGKRRKETEIKHLIKIFQIFEKFAANILAKPWCKELHTIKVTFNFCCSCTLYTVFISICNCYFFPFCF